MPSCLLFTSMDVSCGVLSLAKSELLKDTMDKSSGMRRPNSYAVISMTIAMISSLTTRAVGLFSEDKNSVSSSALLLEWKEVRCTWQDRKECLLR